VRAKKVIIFGVLVAGFGYAAVVHNFTNGDGAQHAVGSPGILQQSRLASVADFNRDGTTTKEEWRQYWFLRGGQ